MGLFGGDDAVSAIAAVHVYENKRWMGWYNTPGSFKIAKRFRSFAKSTSFHNLSPTSHSNSVHMDPTALFQLGSGKGPRFRAVHTGTVIEETGYLSTLFMKECIALGEGKVVPGRKTHPIGITIADIARVPAPEMNPTCNAFTLLLAGIHISVSIGSYALCAVRGDWYASLSILAGIIVNSVSHLVLGSADFVFTRPKLVRGSLPGDGILGSDKDMVVLRGTEGAVNSITRGRFSLRFPSKGHYNLIRSCSVLFFIQFITQLLLIPHALLFGHLMFLTSLGASALYNAWLSSPDKERIHRKLLLERVLENPTLTKYTMGSSPAAVVFVLLVLQLQDPTSLLNEFFPNESKVWKPWKVTVLGHLRRPSDQSFLSESKVADLDRFTQEEKDLLQLLYDDAQAAYVAYKDYLGVDPL